MKKNDSGLNIFIALILCIGAVSILKSCNTSTVEPTEQIPIERIEILPSMPDDFGTRDWKKVGRDLDKLTYNTELTGGSYLRKNKFDGDGIEAELYPIIFFDKTRTNYPNRVNFGIPTFLRDQSKQKGTHYEAVTLIPSLIGATLLGIDKSNQDGVNWVSGALNFYQNSSNQNVYLNNPGPDGGGGDSFWYAIYPNVLFSKLHFLYKDKVDFEGQFTAVADTFYKLTDQLDGELDGKLGLPWGYHENQGWDFKEWKTNRVNRSEAEGSCGAAYVLYNAYKETGEQKYLAGAESIMNMLSHPDAKNPTYEMLVGFGALTMARMNAEEDKNYDLDRMLNWVYAEHSDYRPNWGMIAAGEKWYGYNMDGLIGSTVDRGGYGFFCNTCAYIVSVIPVVKYDERYARTLGKWAVNAASALRYFYRYDEKVFPGANQYMADWQDKADPDGCLAHDGIIKTDPEFPDRLPHVCSETHNHEGWWGYDSDISMYSSCHIGEVAAMLNSDTGVKGIIQWNLNVTDYYGNNSYPTFLYYNPHSRTKKVVINVGSERVNIYDSVSNQILKSNQTGKSKFKIEGDSARVIVLIPSAATLEVVGNKLKANGITIDNHYGPDETKSKSRDIDSCVKILEEALKSRSIQDLAGKSSHMMGAAKNDEIVDAARNNELTVDIVAAYAQSVHKEVLESIENELGFPSGFFRAAMRQSQFGSDYGFIGEMPSSIGTRNRLQFEIREKFSDWMAEYKANGGKAMPSFPMQLTGIAQGKAPRNEREEKNFLKELVEDIPGWELQKRHAYITKLSSSKVPGLQADIKALNKKPLVNMDHLLKVLGSIHEDKLCVSVYGENVPADGQPIRYVPIHALGEGAFCVDDIARTVVALAHEYKTRGGAETLNALTAGAEYLMAMQTEDGEFYNFGSVKDGNFSINTTGRTSKKGIGWWSARAVWGLSEAYSALAKDNKPIADKIKNAIDKAITPHLSSLERYGQYHDKDGMQLPKWLFNDASDQTTIFLNGLIAYFNSLPEGEDKNRTRDLVEKFTEGIVAAQIKDLADPECGRFLHSAHTLGAKHLWGSQQMEVVAKAGQALNKPEYIESAKLCADNYWHNTTHEKLSQNRGAEIAYAVGSVTAGFTALYEATGEKKYADEAENWVAWFAGHNGARAIMYDTFSGRGYDGIDPVRTANGIIFTISANSGAESTVEAVMAIQAVECIPGAHDRLKAKLADMLPK